MKTITEIQAIKILEENFFPSDFGDFETWDQVIDEALKPDNTGDGLTGVLRDCGIDDVAVIY